MDSGRELDRPVRVLVVSPSLLMQSGLRTLIDSAELDLTTLATVCDFHHTENFLAADVDRVVLDVTDLHERAWVLDLVHKSAEQFGPVVLVANRELLNFAAFVGQPEVAAIVDYRDSRRDLLAALCSAPPDQTATPAAELQRPEVTSRAPRVDVELPVRLEDAAGTTRNISATGIFLEVASTSHQIGDELQLEIDIHSPEGNSLVIYRGKVVRRETTAGRVRLAVSIVEQSIQVIM